MTVAFDPNTGTVVVDSETWSLNDQVTGGYTDTIQKGIGRATDPSYPKSVNAVAITGQVRNVSGQAPSKIVVQNSTADKLPNVTLIQVGTQTPPTLKTVSYTDASGNTRILFNNNNVNKIETIQGGIQVFGLDPVSEPAKQVAVSQSPSTGPSATFWIGLLFILMIGGAIVFFLTRK
jgi:LPXTG-motif cell wall-anchored protein